MDAHPLSPKFASADIYTEMELQYALNFMKAKNKVDFIIDTASDLHNARFLTKVLEKQPEDVWKKVTPSILEALRFDSTGALYSALYLKDLHTPQMLPAALYTRKPSAALAFALASELPTSIEDFAEEKNISFARIDDSVQEAQLCLEEANLKSSDIQNLVGSDLVTDTNEYFATYGVGVRLTQASYLELFKAGHSAEHVIECTMHNVLEYKDATYLDILSKHLEDREGCLEALENASVRAALDSNLPLNEALIQQLLSKTPSSQKRI